MERSLAELAYEEIDYQKVKQNLILDFCLGKEFENRQKGYAFVVDVFNKMPQLGLYKISKYSSRCDIISNQPPREMLEKAVAEQGGNLERSAMYDINNELRQWVEENLLCD